MSFDSNNNSDPDSIYSSNDSPTNKPKEEPGKESNHSASSAYDSHTDFSFPFGYQKNSFDSMDGLISKSMQFSQNSYSTEESSDSRESNIYSMYIPSNENSTYKPRNIIHHCLSDENFIGKNTSVSFDKTVAYTNLKNFIYAIDNSIKTENQIIVTDQFLIQVDQIVETTPLSDAPVRFANAAMKTVIEKIHSATDNTYLRESFGSEIRMDFGTGHELNFLCHLYVLYRDGKVRLCSVFSILNDYFKIIRKYLRKYNVEAAGARGCWSIDDYQLLPYLFGSSENFKNPQNINRIFSGAFYEAWAHREPTGLLKSICSLDWPNINIRMLDFYDKEVFKKKVVTQHFIYSKYLPDEYSLYK